MIRSVGGGGDGQASAASGGEVGSSAAGGTGPSSSGDVFLARAPTKLGPRSNFLYSTARAANAEQEELDALAEAQGRRVSIVRQMCTPANVAWIVLLVALVVVSVGLPIVAWNDSVSERNQKEASDFATAVVAYSTALKEALQNAGGRVLQYSAFLQHVRDCDAFRSFTDQDSDLGGSKLYIPIIKHDERAAFEAEVTAENRVFTNDSSYRCNLTDFVQNGTVTVLVPAPVQDEYMPVRCASTGSNVAVVCRNLASEPTRNDVIVGALATGDAFASKRVISGAQRATVAVANVVYDKSNLTKPIGSVLMVVAPRLIVPQVSTDVVPISLRLRVFDVTGDGVDQVGCLKPILYDGVRDEVTGDWTDILLDKEYCPSNPRGETSNDDILIETPFAQRTWLLVFSKGPHYDEEQVDPSMLVASSIVTATAVLAIVGVLIKGYWLVGSLRESQREVMMANQKTKDFLAFITHELRNPLFGILGTSGELRSVLEEQQASEEAVQLVNSIELGSERMSTIINDVLSVRKLEEGQMVFDASPFALRDVANEVFAMFAARARKGKLRLTVVVDGNVPQKVVGDAGRIVQVLSNLLSNALKFTPEGGTVTLHIAHDDGEVFMEVEDSGCGLAEDVIPHLFRPYTQENARIARSHGGTGLGLSICKQLVEGMGGEVRVMSEVGVGTRFTVVLPLREPIVLQPVPQHSELPPPRRRRVKVSLQDSEAPGDRGDSPALTVTTLSNRPAPSNWQGALRVLVVDDQAVNVRVLKRLLVASAPNLRVDGASNGGECLDKVESSEHPYSLIFMDVQMPTMDGRTAVRELRKRGHTVPVVAISGSGDEQELEANREAGFDETVLKPMRISKLLGLLRKYARLS